jgi:multiple sugar transport system permease protein
MNRASYVPYALIAPSVVFLLLVFAWPLLETVWIAMSADGAFTTQYLKKMTQDVNFAASLKNTLLLVALVVPLQLCFALSLATLLGKLERGRFTYLYIWAIPLGISDLAAGLAWLSILTERGYLTSVLAQLGVIESPVNWLNYHASPGTLLAAILVAEVWRATPIVLVILVAGLQLIPKEFGEAAQVFGASAWQRFTRVTLPLLKPSLQTALILRTVMAFEVFAVVFALAGRDYALLVGEAYQWQHAYQNTHVASAYAIVILLLSIVATLVYLRTLHVKKEMLP